MGKSKKNKGKNIKTDIKCKYEIRWVWYHSVLAIELFIADILLLLLLLE